MHVKYKLRKTSKLIVPKGPNFTRAPARVYDIDGTVIKFKAPRHRSSYYEGKPVLPKCRSTLDEYIFRAYYSEESNVRDNWRKAAFFYHVWDFYGPWFTGLQAILTMNFSLIKPVNYEHEFSLFHPRAFEKIVTDYLINDYSKRRNTLMEGDPFEYITPVNWQPMENFPCVAVQLEVHPDLEVVRSTVRYLVFFPISDKAMAYINFEPSQLLALPQEELDKRVDRSTMLELINNIISSFELKLSPQARAQQKTALEGLEDTSLVKDFPPIKWDQVSVPEASAQGKIGN